MSLDLDEEVISYCPTCNRVLGEGLSCRGCGYVMRRTRVVPVALYDAEDEEEDE